MSTKSKQKFLHIYTLNIKVRININTNLFPLSQYFDFINQNFDFGFLFFHF